MPAADSPGSASPAGVTRPPAIVVSRAMGTVVVSVHGDLDLPASKLLGGVLGDLIDGQGNLAIMIDLRRLRRVDPAGLEVLAHAASALGAHRGSLTLHEPCAAVRDALTLAGIVGLVTAGGQAMVARVPAGDLICGTGAEKNALPSGRT